MDQPKLTAILLAAGSSIRMGTANKLLLPFRDKLIIQHLVDKLAAAKIDELILVLGHEAELVKNNIPSTITTAFNPDHKTGMTSSIQTGVQQANESHHGFMICLADQVLMETSDYNQIIAAWKAQFLKDKQCIVLPFFEEQKGNPVIFSSGYKDEILAQPAGNGCKVVVEKHKAHLHMVEMANGNVLVDVDTVEDLASAAHSRSQVPYRYK